MPAPHEVQLAWTGLAWKAPAAHPVQALADGPAYWPVAQLWHAEDESAPSEPEAVPKGQGRQAVAPVLGWNAPLTHGAQLDAPGAESRPAAQAAQLEAPDDVWKVPAAHPVQPLEPGCAA